MNQGSCYKNEMNAGCGPAEPESLTSMMKETGAMAAEVLEMVHRIGGHLFGLGNPCEEKGGSPKCFLDELAKTRRELGAAVEELANLQILLGI